MGRRESIANRQYTDEFKVEAVRSNLFAAVRRGATTSRRTSQHEFARDTLLLGFIIGP